MSEQTSLAEVEKHIMEQAERAFRLGDLYKDEGDGWLYRLNNKKPLQWSKDPERQARFLKGFNDANEVLRVAAGVAAATPSPTEAA